MHQLKAAILDRISSGLKRKSLTKCSRWAMACRVMGTPYPGAWSFDHHPWLREMHDSEAELNVGQKAAQMGYTETILNIVLYNLDIKQVDCLYVLPNKNPDAGDFSAGRFNQALELSPHLMKGFTEVQNVGHKRFGSANLYIRGSNSRAGLKSVPTGLIVLDELAEHNADNIELALQRSAGQLEKRAWMISTPTIPKANINYYFETSTQEHFWFRCPACSQYTELKWPESIVITADEVTDPRIAETHLICYRCKARLEHKEKYFFLKTGKWVPEYTDRDARGFYINQMYSSTVSPPELARSYIGSMKSSAQEQEFFNSNLGVPHIPTGAGVTLDDLERSMGGHRKGLPLKAGLITMGIDVGKYLHYEIDSWHVPELMPTIDLNVQAKCKIIDEGKVTSFEELDRKMRDNLVNFAVIDANPERRKAYEFAARHFGRVRLCFYGQGIQGKQIHANSDDEQLVTIDRTSWLDLSLGRFRSGGIRLPIDLSKEYKDHVQAIVRIYEKDKSGNHVARYVTGNTEDHFAHARNYAELALPFALGIANHQTIQKLP